MDFTVKMISNDGLDMISYDSNFYIEDGILYHGTEELARDVEDDILYAVQKIIEFCSDTVLKITDQDDELVYKNDEFEDNEFEDILDESKITTMNFKALNEELEKLAEEINYHENSEDIGTIDVTWIGIEKGDNDEDTIFFYKDLDTNEYFYQSEELDRDGFKTLEDAIEDAKKGCKEITNNEFFKGVKFSKFNK